MQAALARARAAAPALGVTRLAMLTGLDRVGLPVATAYRPNSRSVAVHVGKGMTPDHARLSALMEAAECFHAEMADPALHWARGADVAGDAGFMDPTALPLTGAVDPMGALIPWTQARRLADGAKVLVPFELVSTDLSEPAPPGFGVFLQTSNGMGAGVETRPALLHALAECVERDAVADWHALDFAGQTARRVDPAGVDGPESGALLAMAARAELACVIWDLSDVLGVPVFQAMVLERPEAWEDAGQPEPELGSACHPSRDRALARALAEALQARLARISGARDDFAPASYGPGARAARLAAASRHVRAPAMRRFRAAPDFGDQGAEAGLDALLGALDRAGRGGAAWVDLSRPEIGLAVVRVIVPGLRGPAEEMRA